MSWVERRVVASFVHFGDYTIAITQRRFTTEYPSSYPPRAIRLSNPPPHTKPALRTQGGSHPRVWPPTATGPCRPMASTRGLGKRMSAPRDATPCITDDSNDWIKAYHRIPREQRREDHRKGRMKGATGLRRARRKHERAASRNGPGRLFASQACKTLQSCDDLPSEERPQCLRTQHTRPDGYDGIDFTRCHIRDGLRSTIATLDSSSDDHGLSVFEALGPMLHDGPLKLQYPYMPASKREAAVRLLRDVSGSGQFLWFSAAHRPAL